MGKRGPQPTPTAILNLRGSWRGKLNKREPKPEPNAPRMPARLSDEAKAAWRRIVPQLEQMGVIGRIDGERLSRYCELAALWWRAKSFVERYGTERIVQQEDGRVEIVEYPQVRRLMALDERLTRAEQAFGMDPSSRSRLTVQDQEGSKKEDGKSRFFKTG